MKRKPKILVTGATGKTGSHVTKKLLALNYPVRALVHRIDGRSNELEALGAEVYRGDFLDIHKIRISLEDIQRVYFCYPAKDKLWEAAMNIAIVAKDEGIESLVNMSQISSRQHATSPLTQQHWLSEHMFDWAGIGVTHIHPTFFAEDLYLFNALSIRDEGKLLLAFGEGKHAPIAALDIANVVVDILRDPKMHIGKHYILTGDQEMSMDEIADVLTKVLGKLVLYINLPIEDWHKYLTGKVGLSKFLATHLAGVALDHQNGIFSGMTDTVARISSVKPQSLEQFIKGHRAQFI